MDRQSKFQRNFKQRLLLYLFEATRRLLKCLNVSYFPVYIEHHKIYIRTFNQVDINVLNYVFRDFNHRPFYQLMNERPVILDLGVNIGCTILDFKKEYPLASIIGCEMDADNYKMAIKNCSKYDDVKLLNVAAWHEDGCVNYFKGIDTYSNPDAYSIVKDNINSSSISAALLSVRAVSVNSLIREFSLKEIDYVKMDIEGAELEVIQKNNDWLKIVKQINIEYHTGEVDAKKIMEALIAKGFNPFKGANHPSTIIALKA